MMAATFDPVLLPSKLVRDLIDDNGRYNIRAICQIMGITAALFAQLTHRATESVAKSFAESAPNVKPRDARTQRVVAELVQIIGILRAMGLDRDAARWMHTPLPSFSGQTPAALITEGRGQELVERLLAVASGNIGA